jgi:hypothetical protein
MPSGGFFSSSDDDDEEEEEEQTTTGEEEETTNGTEENGAPTTPPTGTEGNGTTTPPEAPSPEPQPAPAPPAPPAQPTAPPPAASPAIFTISNIFISPDTVAPDETVTITVDVVNTGESEDMYTVVLKINGAVENTQSISLAGGQSRQVVFTTAKSQVGSYTVEINGQSAIFQVVEQTQLVLILGVIGGVIVLGLIIFLARRIYLLKTGY